ncbi:polysaccharide biosynthesis tyrosine autokinase [Williamsia deligens]|uniref:non-specific protein-tyrosine kinase n=1 Tax=Williamsia deligens TaxID=321325 RepID=A0ABW3G6N4_9NOCA|nr:polysaccharide biosynthesis tyrosine autokinase [Williamsia deligens]MCP2194519.1 capsular exopolysaccharide family [Williamsia deligens]
MTLPRAVENDAGGRAWAEPDRDGIRQVLAALRRGWLAIVATAVVFGLLALGYSLAQKPQYAAVATMYVTSGTDDNTTSAYQGSLASQQRVTSYQRLVTSRAVVQQAIQEAGLRLSLDDAKKALSSASAANSVLLTITAVEPDRDTAENLANAVARSMTSYVARLETPSGGGQPLAKLTLVDPAQAGSSPVTPKTTRNVALGVPAGLLIGLVGVVARARLSNRIRREEDLGLVSELPVLGAIPSDGALKRRHLIDFSTGGGAAAESFRKVRTNLTYAAVDNPPRVILVTSPAAAEGKTTTAMNLAASLVEAGHRVLLLDADLRRPQVNERLGLLGEVGLTNHLRGEGTLADLVQPTSTDGLWVLASGPRPPNPAELVGTQRAGQALEEVRRSFEYVIVDAPPVLPVTDAVVLSRWVDGVLVVVRSGATRRRDLTAALAQLDAGGALPLGLVLMEAPQDRRGYGYYTVNKRPRLFGRG